MKNSIKRYFKFLKNIFSHKTIYRTLRNESLSRTIGYYLLSAFLCTFLISTAGTILGTAKMNKKMTNASVWVTNIFPDDLVLTFKNSQLSINKTEPYLVPMATNLTENSIKNIAMFNTTSNLTLEQLNNASAFIVATRDKAYVLKNTNGTNSGYNIFPYTSLRDRVVDKPTYSQMVSFYTNKLHSWMPGIIFLGSLFIFTIFFLLNMFASLLFAFIVVLISMLKGWQFNYEEGYKLALMATLPILLLGFILSLFHINFPMKNLILLIIFFFIMIPKNKAEPVEYSI